MKRNDGFTMIELLVSVTAGALVTFAAVSLLLLGTRIQHGSTSDVKEQQTVRTVLALMEEMAGNGDIQTIKNTYSGWQLLNKEGAILFEYVNTDQAIYQGKAPEGEALGAPLLTGLNNAGVTMEGRLMRMSFETDRGESYVTRVYCRTVDVTAGKADDVEDMSSLLQSGKDKIPTVEDPSATNARLAFLNTLATQYNNGNNAGEIQYFDGANGPQYYSQWYIGSGWGKNGWNKDTPWCACFVSWGAVTSLATDRNDDAKDFVFANVDEGMRLFKDPLLGGRWKDAKVTGAEDILPGDYIFFDWSGEKKDPAHVGVVLDVRGGDVYTLEGNSSNRVAVRKYSLNEPDIMGYGVLPKFVE